MNKRIFALDIGTRSVTGILLDEQDGKFTLVDYATKEHQERSMIDGQIHDVVSVSNVIKDVKETLEKKHGPLHEVSVAAAGRALKTVRAEATLSLNQQPLTEQDMIKHIELSAVQQAQKQLIDREETYAFSHYYCVGYSILHYELDGEKIGSLIDQRGEKATVEVIATFLPKVVVESLLAALQRAHLHMHALTLEPIAAIHVLIPESMRRLNVALIDIGAGTSDIALTNDGTVVAYGMVPHAGDKITEAISDAYILDFPQAEQAKKEIVSRGDAIIQDILGFETKVTLDELLPQINQHIQVLAKTLAAEILALNSTVPQAIMLIGGGSLTPSLSRLLAEKIGLPTQRVAVRDVDGIQALDDSDHLPNGPDYITPIGIAITSKQNPVHYISVTVNKQSIRMFEMKQLTVGDALIQAGIEIKKMYGKPGIALFITWNEKAITIPGYLGTAPRIFVNGIKGHVDTPVQQNDEISVSAGTNGTSPYLTLNEFIGDLPSISIMYNKEQHLLTPSIIVNGKRQNGSTIISDKDSIEIKHVRTVADFLQSIGSKQTTEPFTVFVNNERVHLDQGKTHLHVNKQVVEPSYTLQPNDHLSLKYATTIRVKDVLEHLHIQTVASINITFDEMPIQLEQQVVSVKMNEEPIALDAVLPPNSSISIYEKEQPSFIFQDVFRYIDIDVTKKSGSFMLENNGKEATFFEPLFAGDQLCIRWEK